MYQFSIYWNSYEDRFLYEPKKKLEFHSIDSILNVSISHFVVISEIFQAIILNEVE